MLIGAEPVDISVEMITSFVDELRRCGGCAVACFRDSSALLIPRGSLRYLLPDDM